MDRRELAAIFAGGALGALGRVALVELGLGGLTRERGLVTRARLGALGRVALVELSSTGSPASAGW